MLVFTENLNFPFKFATCCSTIFFPKSNFLFPKPHFRSHSHSSSISSPNVQFQSESSCRLQKRINKTAQILKFFSRCVRITPGRLTLYGLLLLVGGGLRRGHRRGCQDSSIDCSACFETSGRRNHFQTV